MQWLLWNELKTMKTSCIICMNDLFYQVQK